MKYIRKRMQKNGTVNKNKLLLKHKTSNDKNKVSCFSFSFNLQDNPKGKPIYTSIQVSVFVLLISDTSSFHCQLWKVNSMQIPLNQNVLSVICFMGMLFMDFMNASNCWIIMGYVIYHIFKGRSLLLFCKYFEKSSIFSLYCPLSFSNIWNRLWSYTSLKTEKR